MVSMGEKENIMNILVANIIEEFCNQNAERINEEIEKEVQRRIIKESFRDVDS